MLPTPPAVAECRQRVKPPKCLRHSSAHWVGTGVPPCRAWPSGWVAALLAALRTSFADPARYAREPPFRGRLQAAGATCALNPYPNHRFAVIEDPEGLPVFLGTASLVPGKTPVPGRNGGSRASPFGLACGVGLRPHPIRRDNSLRSRMSRLIGRLPHWLPPDRGQAPQLAHYSRWSRMWASRLPKTGDCFAFGLKRSRSPLYCFKAEENQNRSAGGRLHIRPALCF